MSLMSQFIALTPKQSRQCARHKERHGTPCALQTGLHAVLLVGKEGTAHIAPCGSAGFARDIVAVYNEQYKPGDDPLVIFNAAALFVKVLQS